MKKQAKTKSKPVKRSKNSEVPQPELPDLVTVMMKVAERLDGLEKKMENILSQLGRAVQAPRPQENRPQAYSNPQHSHGQRPQHQQQQYGNQNSGRPQGNFQQNTQIQNRNPNQQQHSDRRERPLYKTVCADCRKDCEIPFKPTGDRPVYCKECFAQRKNSNQSPKNNQGPHLTLQQKSVKVIPNGVGKVTISEMVPAASREAVSKRKSQKSAKKSR